MKSISTLLLGLLMTLSLSAQMPICEPDMMFADSSAGVYPLPFEPDTRPDGGITECAIVGQEYFFNFTIKIDSTFEVAGSDFRVDSLIIKEVNGLPNGITYGCNPENCSFPGNSISCAAIFGTPTDDNPQGEYELEIVGELYSGGLNFELSFPNPLFGEGKYILSLAGDANDPACATTSTTNPLAEQLSIKNTPNPFHGLTTIEVSSALNGNFTFEVRDLLGQRLHHENIQLQTGQNSFDYEATNLPKGLYLYSISDGVHVVSRKMMVQ